MKVSSSLNTVCIPGRERVGLMKGNLLSGAWPGPNWDAHYQYLFVFLSYFPSSFQMVSSCSVIQLQGQFHVAKPSRHRHSHIAPPQSCSPSARSFRYSLLQHPGFHDTTFYGVSSNLLPCLLQSSLPHILHQVAGCWS